MLLGTDLPFTYQKRDGLQVTDAFEQRNDACCKAYGTRCRYRGSEVERRSTIDMGLRCYRDAAQRQYHRDVSLPLLGNGLNVLIVTVMLTG